MGWSSILPDHLSTIETWIARIFLLLCIITMGPWALLLVYDFLYYLWRTAIYNMPYFGGKALGKRRPRAPSLIERPSGRRRNFSVSIPKTISEIEGQDSDSITSTKRDSGQTTALEGK